MKRLNLIIAVLALLGLALTTVPAPAFGAEYEFRFAQIVPAAHPYYSKISEPWAREIEKTDRRPGQDHPLPGRRPGGRGT